MSRIPTPDRLRLAEQIQSLESFADKAKLVRQSMPNPAATLTALQYEAVAVIGRLAELVDRGGNAVNVKRREARPELKSLCRRFNGFLAKWPGSSVGRAED